LQVKLETMARLRKVQRLLDRYRTDESLRMGNQLSDIVETEGRSWARLKALSNWEDQAYGEPLLDVRKLAEAAAVFKGYNCVHIGAKAFADLVALGIDAQLTFVRGDSHSYVLIGDVADPRTKDEDIVVVDAWAKFPMAHTLRTARCKFPRRRPGEEKTAYSQRLRASGWAIAGSWSPEQRGWLDGFDLSGTARRNRDGHAFDPESELPVRTLTFEG
jgi:hypothetical protein